MTTECQQLQVPSGWTKAEHVVVSRKTINFRGAWVLEQKISFDFSDPNKSISHDHVAFIWFFTFDELANFLKWWHK